MPHLHLEHSPNLKEKIDPQLLFAPCFDIVSQHLKVEVSVCSGRVTVSDLFYMGDKKQQGFIFLHVVLKEGRPLEVLQSMGAELLKALERYFAQTLLKEKFYVSVRLSEFSTDHFFRN